VIAVDTSSMVAFLQGERGTDVDHLQQALAGDRLVLPPPVLTELLSDPGVGEELAAELRAIRSRFVTPGYWSRAGQLRAAVLAGKRRARLGDALIAQFCLDYGMPIITRDRDFRGFAAVSALEIVD
jgi:predicted nucleic acid-binding protein